MPAATVTTSAKPHGQQQLARDLEVERAVMGYAASGKVGLVSVHLSRIQRLLQAVTESRAGCCVVSPLPSVCALFLTPTDWSL